MQDGPAPRLKSVHVVDRLADGVATHFEEGHGADEDAERGPRAVDLDVAHGDVIAAVDCAVDGTALVRVGHDERRSVGSSREADGRQSLNRAVSVTD